MIKQKHLTEREDKILKLLGIMLISIGWVLYFREPLYSLTVDRIFSIITIILGGWFAW